MLSGPNTKAISPFKHNQYDPNDTVPVFAKTAYKGDPRDQSIISFLNETFCPVFSFVSFSFIIIVINILVFIITLFINGFQKDVKPYKFLPVNWQTFNDISLFGKDLRANPGHIYRWIVHDFLHSSFEHVFSNCFGILIIGTLLEYFIGTWKYIIIYFASGLLGSLFSVLIDHRTPSVGASICCYGIIAALLGFDFLNWQILPQIYGIQSRCSIVTLPIIMLLFILPTNELTNGHTKEGEGINVYGHIGGAIFGFILSLIIIRPKDNNYSCGCVYKYYLIFGIVCTALFTILGFLLFYLLNYYKE